MYRASSFPAEISLPVARGDRQALLGDFDAALSSYTTALHVLLHQCESMADHTQIVSTATEIGDVLMRRGLVRIGIGEYDGAFGDLIEAAATGHDNVYPLSVVASVRATCDCGSVYNLGIAHMYAHLALWNAQEQADSIPIATMTVALTAIATRQWDVALGYLAMIPESYRVNDTDYAMYCRAATFQQTIRRSRSDFAIRTRSVFRSLLEQ